MNDRERLSILRMNHDLASLGENALGELIVHFDEVVVRAGTCIAVEGRLCHEFIVVAEGRLSRNREQDVVAGESLGWKAMQARGAHETTTVAATDARLLVMSHAQFAAISAARPRKPSFLLRALPSSRRPLPRRQHLERA
ncbi:MAG TPA: cyclic nucleotide-binding domain-containing protein [Candidatus Udaeobacter sp.]|nr:cyclic nucleotide-binding domain-containing protein [Candidatus Udaeobacter sp.]